MDNRRLIPYSVHLPEPIYQMIKQAAGERKAASMVRDAIIAFVEKRNSFDQGYQAGIDAAIKKINNHKVASVLRYKDDLISDSIVKELSTLVK